MKNKRKSILVIFIIFFVILGLSYYTNAAENLKALQDKYRISYNNLTKALKEGADQDRIDQLSAQCKEDYAEYQKVVKGKNGSINKPSTSQTKPAGTTAPKVDSQSTNVLIKQKILIPQNNKSVKINKPSQPIQVKLARITDINYGPGYISDLPPGFDDIKDETLKQRLKTIHEKASSWDLYLFCSNQYPNIPDLCGLARLYYIQAQIKNNSNFSGVVLGDHLAYLEQIKTFYENPKTKITEFIIAEIDKMFPKLKEYNDDKIKKADEQIKTAMTSYENYTKYITDKDGKFSPETISGMKGSINSACIKVNSAYWELGIMYSKIGDYKGLKALTDDYKNNFYNKIAANYDVNCIQPDLSVKPVRVSLDYKESNQYFDLHDKCILTYLKHAETVDDGEEIFNKVTGNTAEGATETNNIDKLLQRMQTPFQGDSGKNLVKESGLSDYQLNSYKEKMKIYKKKQVVKKIYFTKYEDVEIKPSYESGGLLCSYEIPSPKDLICVKCQVVPNADSYDDGFTCFYPIKIKIKSSISNRERTVIVKKTVFSGYSKQIQLVTDPMSTEPEKSLIKSHGNDSKNQFQHTVSVVDGVEQLLQIPAPNIDYFQTIKEKSFLKEWLGSAVIQKRAIDPIDTVTIRSESISAMGFETIFASTIDENSNKITNFFTVKNQADWCIIAAHGSKNGNLAVTAKNVEPENGKPILFDSINIVPNNVSFLLLISCDLLNIPLNKYKITSETLDIIKQSSGIKWCKKMTGNVSILGYSETIRPISKILGNFFESIKSSVSYPYSEKFKEFVADQWIETHQDFYQEQAKNILAQYPERPPKEELEDLVETADVINDILSAKSIYNEWYHELIIDNNYDLSCYGVFTLHMKADVVITNLNMFL